MIIANPKDPLRHLPDAAGALLVLVLGLTEFAAEGWLQYSLRWPLVALVIAGTALCAGLVRRAPAVALGLTWLIPCCQAITSTPLLTVQIAVVAVFYGAARWGRTATLWVSALSIPAGALVMVVLLDRDRALVNPSIEVLAGEVRGLGIGWRIGGVLVLNALFGAPWLAGLTMRVSDRARQDRDLAARERSRTEEAMRIREAQTRLARDVHDVVGHSLAVILAQAESGQFLPDDNPAALKAALSTIAGSARTSLQDVRKVLSATRGPADDLESLIENLRSGGHEVISSQFGTPKALTPDQQSTAYRVLQEMLTNAIRHGRRDGAVIVQRTWDDALTVEVRNAIGDTPPPDPAIGDEPPAGSGIEGMRERLAAVDGTLTTSRRADVFVATARIPL